MKTLVLTPWMSPFLIVSWQTAITMVWLEKVDVLEEYEGEDVSSPSVTMAMPAVVRLKRSISGVKKGVKFSRTNVLVRDRHTCQWCGVRKPPRELNYDHVVARARGGKTTWENVVASCYPCNTRKGSHRPEDVGMRLLRKPVRPLTLPLEALALEHVPVPREWEPYTASQRSA
jgi:5-methylcytosine-specific restriction endonuclease McrA